MGMYDYITATCPDCYKPLDDQVKIQCCFYDYNIDEPMFIGDATDILGHELTCDNCRKTYEVVGDVPTHKVSLYLKEKK